MFAIKEIIDMAIRIEKNGEAVYRSAMEKISNPALVSLLEWMADEEDCHAKWFSDLKQEVDTLIGTGVEETRNGNQLSLLPDDKQKALTGGRRRKRR